ncbi:MAG: ABC transporter substrate-binding protein [Chloroflexi bacterium]|nr:ABC transporter substrate-binding protein [Chloroflexota bacterium]
MPLLLAACVGAPAAQAPTASQGTETPKAPEATTGNGASDQFLAYGYSGEPSSLDSMNTNGIVITSQIEETLINFKPGTLELAPGLAEKWTPNADSTEWTFTLRTGIKFHDDTDFNADAVVFNFLRISDPSYEFGFRKDGNTFAIFPYIFGGFVGEPSSLWKGIEKVDDQTVKFTLTRPTPLFPNYIAAPYFGISSPDAVKKAGAKYGTPEFGGVGTGPFKFLEWQAGQSLTLVRFDGYWGDKAKMPSVVVRFIKDAPERLAELQAGAIDLTTDLAPDARDTITNDADLALTPLEAFNIAFLSLNINNKPFDNPKVRQAIAYAIDKQAILDSFYGGIGTVADDFLPDSLGWARPAKLEAYAYNPEKAKALLAEAGYADGFSTVVLTDTTEVPLEFWYIPVSRPYFPTPKPIAEAIATYLADVGIKVELKTEDWGVYLKNWNAGTKNGIVQLGWTGDYGDPNNFLASQFGAGSATQAGYKNEAAWKLLDEAGAAKTLDESTQLFQQAGVIINQDLPRIPIVHAPPVYAQKKALTGWVPSPTSGESWATIFIQK